jgi:hypothetical protein
VKVTYAAVLEMDEDEPIVCTKRDFELANGDDEDEDEEKRKKKDEEDEDDDDDDDGEIAALQDRRRQIAAAYRTNSVPPVSPT